MDITIIFEKLKEKITIEFEVGQLSLIIGRLWHEELWNNLLRVSLS